MVGCPVVSMERQYTGRKKSRLDDRLQRGGFSEIPNFVVVGVVVVCEWGESRFKTRLILRPVI
jgi:hypothetical protein